MSARASLPLATGSFRAARWVSVLDGSLRFVSYRLQPFRSTDIFISLNFTQIIRSVSPAVARCRVISLMRAFAAPS